MILPLTKYYSGDQVEKNEIGRACSIYGGEVYTGFWWGNLRGKKTTQRTQTYMGG